MANNFKPPDPQQSGTSGTNLQRLTDWNHQCVLCQKDTIDPLSCPADSKRKEVLDTKHSQTISSASVRSAACEKI